MYFQVGTSSTHREGSNYSIAYLLVNEFNSSLNFVDIMVVFQLAVFVDTFPEEVLQVWYIEGRIFGILK